jgi:hypothetical protein
VSKIKTCLSSWENKLLFHESNFSAISCGEQVTFSCEQFFSYIMGRTSYFFMWAIFSYIMGRTSYFFTRTIFQLHHVENKLLLKNCSREKVTCSPHDIAENCSREKVTCSPHDIAEKLLTWKNNLFSPWYSWKIAHLKK